MTRRFIIIDNRDYLIANTVQLLLTIGAERSDIWPPDDEPPTTSWDHAFGVIHNLRKTGWDPQQTECYILFDLALDEAQQSFLEGVQQIQLAQTQLRDYVVVVLSVYSAQAARDLRASGFVDEVVERSETHGDSGGQILALALDNALRSWSQRTGRANVTTTTAFSEDSPGMRALQAAFSPILIDQLLRQNAEGWSSVCVTALTGGYSGSHIVRIEGKQPAGDRSIVCKVSRSRKALQDEAERAKRLLQSYKTYVGRVAPFIDLEPRPLGANEAWYSIQSSVPGDTLEQLAVAAMSGSVSASDSLRAAIEDLATIAVQLPPAAATAPAISPTFRMLDIDVARFEASSRVLIEIARQCSARKLCSNRLTASAIRAFAKNVVAAWNSRMDHGVLNELPHLEQHGDLNPRNIFVVDDRVQLIDFGRFDVWPAGYDLTRLELQLLLRATDRGEEEDAFPDRLPLWMALWDSVEDGSRDLVDPPESHARLLDAVRRIQAIRTILLMALAPALDDRQQRTLIAAMRCFDAVKICSYQDATIFKRLWFLDIAMMSGNAAGL